MRMSRRRALGKAYEAASWRYSGAHTVMQVTVDGASRQLVKLTGSGTLTVTGEVLADVWMCGCGATGGSGVPGVKGGDGGGGAYVALRTAMRLESGPVTISTSAGGKTMYADLSASGGSAKNGGSGGGGGAMIGGAVVPGGSGDGAADKVPFGLTALFTPHCAGGGGGGFDGGTGGAGGSQGTAGGNSAAGGSAAGGKGGYEGGGAGGIGGATPDYGANALQRCPGAGGGGGGSGIAASSAASGGLGAPGVAYFLLHA